ncbi:MAG TPA: hypothetical protein VKY92_15545 [Verrucomicrobiae bacterium]|nr:hypothetical protein [Verrucomicrobiae bacterium]
MGFMTTAPLTGSDEITVGPDEVVVDPGAVIVGADLVVIDPADGVKAVVEESVVTCNR